MGLYKNTNGNLDLLAGGTLYADAPVGSIQAYGGSSAPWGWLLCQGQAVSRATYAELFGVIGTSFGAGDGSTTFNIPDLRESVPVGTGTRDSGVTTHDTYDIGQFKDDQIQDHTHVYLHIPQDTHSDLHIPSGSGYAYGNLFTYSTGTPNSGRHGDTTHGKQLGVNYIIKATSIALPSDFASHIEDVVDEMAISEVSEQNKLVTESELNDKQSRIQVKSKSITFTGQSSGVAYADVDIRELFGTGIRAVLNVAGVAHLYRPFGFCVTNAGSGDYVIRVWIYTGGSSDVTVSMQFAVITS